MLNIVYMGSTREVLPPLEELLKFPDKFKVVGVVTQGPRKIGRGRKMKESDLAIFCKDRTLPCFTPDRASSSEFIEVLKSLSVDVIITASYGQILSEEFLAVPSVSVINIHPSLLPKYRGATPIQSAIYNGDNITGVTVLYTVKALDAGDIIEQKEYEIAGGETAGELETRMFRESAALLIKALEKILDPSFKGVPQDESKKVVCRKIKKEDALIDWSWKGIDIFNKYRAYHPWPGTCSFFRGKRVNFIKLVMPSSLVYDVSSMIEGEFSFDKSSKTLYVKTSDGYLIVDRLKQEGGKEIGGVDFWNGIREKEGLRFLNQ